MPIFRIKKNRNYTVISNFHLKEKNMSLKAKGLLTLMLSLPDDWDYSVLGLTTLSRDGRDSITSALRELERFGYLKRTRVVNEKGQFVGYDYDVYEQPQAVSPITENPMTGNPMTGNLPQLNTNQPSTKKPNTKKLSKKERKQKKSDFSESARNLNFGKDVSKANAFEKTRGQSQNLSASEKSVACNKPKVCKQANNNGVKLPELSVNDEDYSDKEGLLVCGKCHTRKQVRFKALGKVREPLCLCKCASEQMTACQKAKDPQEKAFKDPRTFNEIIDAYTPDEKLRAELKEHLKVRKQKKGALTNRALVLSLAKLSSIAQNVQDKIKIVQNAIMNGWATFYPLPKHREESGSTFRPSYDLDLFNAMTI